MYSVEFDCISKSFGEHAVLTDVSFGINPGDIVALMGENGAGKSTLMRILAGVYPAGTYAGQLKIKGENVSFGNVQDSKKHGIAMIHQELGLFPELTVAENLLLEEIRLENAFAIPWKNIFNTAQNYLDALGFKLDAKVKIRDLRTGLCQLVEIARSLRSQASILILDEPTSALTEVETEKLFQILKKIQSQNKSIFYVSHRMEEIARIANRMVVLRDGKVAGIDEIKNLNQDKIIRWMVGRDVTHIYPKRKASKHEDGPIFSVKNISLKHPAMQKSLIQNISFDLWPGEILGIGGLMGSGRSELALSLYGYFSKKNPSKEPYQCTGHIIFGKNKKVISSDEITPQLAQSYGMALLTEDRKGTGLFLNRPACENMVITVLKRLRSKFGTIRKKSETALVHELVSHLKIKGPGLHADVMLYSGGNQQKVALAKCIALKPKILILDEPTRGVDINAKLEIYDIMSQLVNQGVAIILISSEMPELLGLSDRVLVLREGELSATFEKPLSGRFLPEAIMKAASL